MSESVEMQQPMTELEVSETARKRAEKVLPESEKGIGRMEEASSHLFRHLAAIPIPVFIATLVVLAILDIRVVFEPPLLIPILNMVFISVVAFIVSYLSARSYLTTGLISLLLLGSGVLAFGAANLVTAWFVGPAGGPNLNVTMYNTGALLGSVFHLMSATSTLAAVTSEEVWKRRKLKVMLAYLGVLVFMALLPIAILQGAIPPFFLQAIGPTLLRQGVLGTAVTLFAISSVLLMTLFFKLKSDFLYWYSLALALIAVGLSVGFLEKAVGSPIGWGGGFAQYLGGIYFLIAVSTVIRGAPTKGIPLEKKDRDLVEIMNVVAYTVDKDGVTTYVSPAIELLIGYSPSEVMGRSFTEFIYQEDLQRSMQSFQRVLSGYTEKNEYRILTKSGEIRWVHTSSRPLLRRNRVVGVQGELTDITERKKTEEALVEERDLFQALIDNIPDAIYFKDDKNRFIRVNKAKAEFSGTSPANMIGKTDFDFFPQEQAKESIADDNRVMESNRPLVDKVEKITHADGTEHWVSVTKIPRYNGKGQVIGTMGISRNITERKKVGEQIKHEAEEWNRTFDAIPDFVFILDRVFRFVRVNKSLADALKVKPEDLIGKTCFEILHKPNKIWPQCPFLEVLKDGRTHTVEVENLNICPSLLVTASPIFDKKGELVGVVHIAKDITERKKIEAALIQSEKLKALGEMAAGVAHDFNNLLAIILGNAQLLERRAERYRLEEIKERLRIIARTAHKGGETVRRLQDFTRKEAPRRDFVKINLNDIVKEAIAATSPRWKDEAEGKGITIRIREELGKLPFIWGSISELKEVLTNLIFNALEAMPQGGEIAIRTEARENEVLLYLTDTGQGIPDSIKEKIFDPFFTTKGPKASGLGLSVCFGVIKRHQGEIKVESTEGKGTTFTISIPVVQQNHQEKENPGSPEEISSRKILVIDDEEGVREVLGEILKEEGHRVTLAETARKGLEEFKQDSFDLVLTDLGMPEMSGWQLAKKIKEIDPGVPVGLITGWLVAITKENMKEEGVDFILSKPFDYSKVVREVNAVLKSKKR